MDDPKTFTTNPHTSIPLDRPDERIAAFKAELEEAMSHGLNKMQAKVAVAVSRNPH